MTEEILVVPNPVLIEIDINRPMDEIKLDIIQRTINLCEGNQTEAAERLKIGRKTIWRKLHGK